LDANPAQQTIPQHVAEIPLDAIDVSDPTIYQNDTWRPYFTRLRNEAPAHYNANSPYGDFWSLTRYDDIAAVEKNHTVFSSDLKNGGVSIVEPPAGMDRHSFIRMDPPDHTKYRKMVSPVANPMNLEQMELLVRERTAHVLDGLPRGEEFDWVTRVSIELTSMMLATLFDYPVEERARLIQWSEIFSTDVRAPGAIVKSEEEKYHHILEFTHHMDEWIALRAKQPQSFDLLSVMAHSEGLREMTFNQRVGILNTMLVAGNDTTRNSMSAGILALDEFPDEMRKLRERPELVAGAASEIIRWQTPVLTMRRNAMEDVEIHGQTIRKGQKVMMWYISANRDERVIDRPDDLIVDRPNVRRHLAFGGGIHRCLGNRIAELQVRVLLEEIVNRDLRVEVLGPPGRVYSNLFRAITSLPVRLS
jgi:cytochrome P450